MEFIDESIALLAQIYASLAARRDDEVGPWKAHLGILLRRDA